MLAYKAVHGPYNWNRFPLVPPGCKAVIYKSPKARISWGHRSTNAWYVRLSLNHYRCNHYFVPKTQAYCISGSAELFPQHCQVLFLMWNKHLQDVIDKLVTTLKEVPPEKRTHLLTLVKKKYHQAKSRTPNGVFLTLVMNESYHGGFSNSAICSPTQTKGDAPAGTKGECPASPSPNLACIMDATPIMLAPNPTRQQALKTTKRTHSRQTQNKYWVASP
jgi:hypothetical protein